jgi:hypothetical protein
MVKQFAVATLFLLPIVTRADSARPSYVVQPGGIVAVVLPLSLLDGAEVRRQLGSGLTTTFLLVARQRETKAVTAARLEIRYDLWDEVWIVRRIEPDRSSDPQRVASREALEKWWKTPVHLLTTAASRLILQLDLAVLPFSAAEEDDARQWMSKAGGVGTTGGASAGLVDALIGTTISAKPIASYRWNVDLSLR